MALFGFEDDEIQIRLTLLLWNLVNGADSGNFLLCKLQPAADEQRISFLCCRSTTIAPAAPAPPLTHTHTQALFMLQMKISHFACTVLTGGQLVPSDFSVPNADDNNQKASFA